MSGFSERFSNLPPGCTDAEIERQANAGLPGCSFKIEKADTSPVSWKVFDGREFVAHFMHLADAAAFAMLSAVARFDDANWMYWTVTVKDFPECPATANVRVSEVDAEMRVHVTHCCDKHGCKYSENETCPVATGKAKQDHPCEVCNDADREDANVGARK